MAGEMRGSSLLVRPAAKGLIPAGEAVVDIPLVHSDPIAGEGAQERPPRLVDSLSVVTGRPATYAFLQQQHVADPGAADVVASGETKPTKELSLERVEARLKVIAVLSDPIDRFILEDASNLQNWVGRELADAVEKPLELEILTGDGSGEHFTGLANVVGIQTQAFEVDRIAAIAAALSKLESFGIAPALIAQSPADALGLQTARNASGAFDLGGAIDPAARTAWGVPYVVVPGLDAGDSYVIGERSAEVSTDGQGVRVEWGTPGDAFERNQLVARVEGRFNLDVLRPHGVVKMSLNG